MTVVYFGREKSRTKEKMGVSGRVGMILTQRKQKSCFCVGVAEIGCDFDGSGKG